MKKILSLTLLRQESRVDLFDENRIQSYLRINFTDNHTFKMYRIPLIENRKYIFPVGVYAIKFEYSPKFNRLLWEFKDIPNRTEIKFHQGTLPKHSKGCPLMTHEGLKLLHGILDSKTTYYVNVRLA